MNSNAQDVDIGGEIQYRLYRKRWIMLAIFTLCQAANAYQWLTYSIITDPIMAYYNVNAFDVNCLAVVYNIVQTVMVFPATFILNKWGLKVSLLVGILSSTIAAWMKVIAVSPDLYWLALLSQILSANGQIFLMQMPTRLPAVWFGSKEVATACAIGVFGNMFGVVCSFIGTPLIVTDSTDVDAIGNELRYMFYGLSGVSTAVSLIAIVGFRAEPPTPPSTARAMNLDQNVEFAVYWQQIKDLFNNSSYIVSFIIYGLIIGVFNTVATLIGQVITNRFPGQEVQAGIFGVVAVAFSLVSATIFGICLDRTHQFKLIVIVANVCSLVAMLLYTFLVLLDDINLLYIPAILIGLFMAGYMTVGYDYGTEVSYPIPEGLSTGFLNIANQIFGIIFTIVDGVILTQYGDVAANGLLSILVLISCVFAVFMKEDLRRQRAQLQDLQYSDVDVVYVTSADHSSVQEKNNGDIMYTEQDTIRHM